MRNSQRAIVFVLCSTVSCWGCRVAVEVDGIGVYKFQLDYSKPVEQAIRVRARPSSARSARSARTPAAHTHFY